MSKLGMWNRAAEIAAQAPPERNRYVDLLRALSISAVVFGHWLMAAPYLDTSVDASANHGAPAIQHLLDIQPWSRWLTWLLQVMPVFFFVGGFSNGVSWDGAQRKGQTYTAWLEARMRRLLGPVVPLVFLWAALGIVAYFFNIHPEMIRIGSQVALVPVWFLAIYFVIVMLVPITREAWRRFGFYSIAAPMMLAVVGDLVYFNTSHQWFGWFNYLFVWSAMHQFGYAWQQERMGSDLGCFIMGVLGVLLLIALTHFGPYPLSLVGVPSQELSNTTPPKLPLMALGIAQIGFLLALERPMRRWLDKAKVWTMTVLVNGLIMPIFLWHSTVMMLLIGACFWLFPLVLLPLPGSIEWWTHRPLWVMVFMTIMLIALPLFLKLEKIITGSARTDVSSWRLGMAAICLCLGLAMLAGNGVTGNGPFGLNWLACSLPILGGFIALFRFPSSS